MESDDCAPLKTDYASTSANNNNISTLKYLQFKTNNSSTSSSSQAQEQQQQNNTFYETHQQSSSLNSLSNIAPRITVNPIV